MKIVKKLLIGLMLCLVTTAGCSILHKPSRIEKTAEQLAEEGTAAFVNGEYKDAIKAYSDLRDWYPFSSYVILADLKIADAHFKLKEYDEAVVAYDHFEKFHPRNEVIPYVIKQIGMSWFNRIDTIDRDLSSARNGMIQFRRLQEQFPDSKEAQEVEEYITKCQDKLAAKELYVADFYFKTKKYKAAQYRYEYIIKHYPGMPQSQIAMQKLPHAIKKVEKEKEESSRN